MKNIEKYLEELKKCETVDEIAKIAEEHGCRNTGSACIGWMECRSEELFRWLLKEHQILNGAEKEYLGNIINPLKTKNTTVVKKEWMDGSEYILFQNVKSSFNHVEELELPCFKTGTMYTGMELDREYTLEELGL